MRIPHLNQPSSRKTPQRGAAFIVMLVILVMGVATVLVSSLSSAGLRIARDEKTAEVLAQAKEALIGYGVSDNTRPGELPCPDLNNNGSLELGVDYTGGIGNPCTSLIGRLPWKTLGLPDLRDASGERLWYAVSDPFHSGDSTPLNSHTAGTITQQDTSGGTLQSGVIAIVFSPGQPLAVHNQVRSTANENNYSHYLESVVTFPTIFKLDTPNDHQGGAYSYNDLQIAITSDALLPPVEKVVASHFKNSTLISSYKSAWGALPFATATKDDYGLLPIKGNASSPYWSLIQETGAGSASCSLRPSGCTGSDCTYARCSSYTSLSAGDVIVITGTIRNVGKGFWRPYDPTSGSDHTASCAQEICVRVTLSGTDWYYPASSIMDNVSTSGSLDSNGDATFTFTGKVRSGYIPNRIQFSTSGMPDYSSSLLSSWFVSNNWKNVMYYVVSPGYTPTAGNACSPVSSGTPPYCLTLGSSSDIAVLAIMTGRKLTGQNPPSPISSDYLEGLNITGNDCSDANQADCIFENKSHDSTFNDFAISVTP
jgi:type II secretory pathway pseudopilin PulG